MASATKIEVLLLLLPCSILCGPTTLLFFSSNGFVKQNMDWLDVGTYESMNMMSHPHSTIDTVKYKF